MMRRIAVPAGMTLLAIALMLVIIPSAGTRAGGDKDLPFTDEFPIAACSHLSTSTLDGAQNRYFPLQIGRVWELSNQECVDAGSCDELEEVRIEVLNQTEIVDGTPTRVVESREWVDGDLVEVARDFYVECVGTEDVYYFGEDVEDGSGNPLPDAWRAGVNGASPGIIFPGGAFLVGARYFQEVAPGVALDRAEHKEMGLDVSTPAGDFPDCVLVYDTNFLEDPRGRNGDGKIYCPGIGLVMDEEAALVSYSIP